MSNNGEAPRDISLIGATTYSGDVSIDSTE